MSNKYVPYGAQCTVGGRVADGSRRGGRRRGAICRPEFADIFSGSKMRIRNNYDPDSGIWIILITP